MGKDLGNIWSQGTLSLSKEESETWKQGVRRRAGKQSPGSALHINIHNAPPSRCMSGPPSSPKGPSALPSLLPWPPSCHLYFLQAKPWATDHTDFKIPWPFPKGRIAFLNDTERQGKQSYTVTAFSLNASWFPLGSGRVRCFRCCLLFLFLSSSSLFWRTANYSQV